MKIMVIVKSQNGGGAERVAADLASSLSKKFETILVVLNAENAIYETTAKVIDLKMPKEKGKTRVVWHLKVIGKVKKLKKEYGITHAVSFMAEADLANVLSGRRDKVIVSVRNKRSSGDQNKLIYAKNKWVFQHADKIAALSRMVGYDLERSFGVNREKITTIYNPCHKEMIKKKIKAGQLTKQEAEFFRKNKGKVIITAGRLERQKGQWHLIRAFGEVVRCIPDAKLLILGKGEKEDYLRSLIRGLKLEDHVYLLGHKANPYIYLSNSDVFAFSSIYEGLGNILIECMACELPVVSADCDFGPKELLDPGSDLHTNIKKRVNGKYGILVPPMDGNEYDAYEPLTASEKLLAEALVDMLRDEKLRMAYKEKIACRGEAFPPEVITQQWIDLLNTV